jgi:hypothetical protein
MKGPRETRDTTIYWAAEPEVKIAGILSDRFDRYRQEIEDLGLRKLWRAAHRAYYGMDPEGSYANSRWITYAGEQGELAVLHVPQFRSLLQQSMAIAIGERMAFACLARSNDPESLAQAIVGRQVLEHDLNDSLEGALRACHERAMVYGMAFVLDDWDAFRGERVGLRQVPERDLDGAPIMETVSVEEPVMGPDGMPIGLEVREVQQPRMRDQPVRAGGPWTLALSPIDVAHDIDRMHVSEASWWIVRTPVPRWDMAARYPEHARTILAAEHPYARDQALWSVTRSVGSECDYVEMLTLYHLPTDAMPSGRLVRVIDKAVLFDGDYPHDGTVVHEHIPHVEIDRAHGYAESWGLMALTRALDSVESGMLTTHDAGAVPNWVAPRSQGVDARELAGGLRLVEFDDGQAPTPPRLAEMPEVRDSSLKLSEHYIRHMQTIFGVNDVVRGDPREGLKAGVALALVASMAVQAQNAQQAAYASLLRRVAAGRIKLYQAFADEERLIRITGRDDATHVKRFAKGDLQAIDGVRVDLASPLTQTLAGKLQLADSLLERYGPEVVPPQVYMAIIETGRVEILTRSSADEVALAQAENERMMRGQPAKILATDDHACHEREHKKPLDDLDLRNDESPEGQARLTLLLQHVQEHQAFLQPAPMEPGSQPTPDTGAPVIPGEPPNAPPNDLAPGARSLPPLVGENMPGLPQNPLTGQPTGGGSA